LQIQPNLLYNKALIAL